MQNENITHIYHIADLHIRNLHRHTEYRKVFSKFLKNVKKDNIKSSVIYIGGDIAHAKTEMSPELIKEISWFLQECANLRDTFVITGNHDTNLANNHRLDVLTPIVDNLKNEKIHYLRDTGVYKFKNITFVVYSILDHKDNWPNGYDVDGEIKICLFHGPVNKAETDIGYTVSSNSFQSDMFDGFDMALLGDIHKRQVISEYSDVKLSVADAELDNYTKTGWKVLSKSNNETLVHKKTAHTAYCGSLIQQNHGEMLEKHGYLLWDVDKRTFTEHNIYNEHGYITIDVKNGKIPQWVYDEIDTKLPKYPRLRLRFEGTDASEMKVKITELKKLFNVSEITVTRTDTMNNLKSGKKLNKNIVGDIYDVNFQNSLIRDYLERHYLLDNCDLDKIDKINVDINSEISKFDLADNILWTPKQFEFSNMFSYGENNKIRFTNARGIIGIFAPNASGKSSLFDALSFCIFDKASRTHLSKNIMNNQKDWFYCKFTFEVDGVDYFIERKGKWVRKGNAVKVDVDFWKEEGGVRFSLNGEQRRDTNKNIEKYLGTFDDFVLTTLSLQGNNALFIDKSQSERKDTLSQFIGVDIFDKLYQVAYETNRDNRTIIRRFNSDDFTDKLANLETSLKALEEEYKTVSGVLSEVTAEIDTANKKLISLNEKIVKLKSDNISIDELLTRKKLLERNIDDIIEDKEKLVSKIFEFEELQLKLEDVLDEFDEDELISKHTELSELRKKKQKLQNTLEKVNIKRDAVLDKIKHLSEHEYNPDCHICIKNSESIINSKADAESLLLDIDKTKTEAEDYIAELQSDIKKLNGIESTYEKYKTAKDNEIKVSGEISKQHSKLSALETKESMLKHQLETQNSSIQDYYENEQQIKKNVEIRSDIASVRSLLSQLKDKERVYNDKVLSLNGQLSSTITQKETIEERIKEVKALEEESKLFQYYLNALSRDGISYELIEKALPMIEGEVNNILAQIVEFGMQLEIDGKSINAYLVYGDQRWSLEMCSGMERFISGLAIRVALINVCNLPRPNFLVIDEGFGTLDAENMQSIYLLFTYLKTEFDFVMVISHIDSMRDVVDDLIEIRKENGFSNVKY